MAQYFFSTFNSLFPPLNLPRPPGFHTNHRKMSFNLVLAIHWNQGRWQVVPGGRVDSCDRSSFRVPPTAHADPHGEAKFCGCAVPQLRAESFLEGQWPHGNPTKRAFGCVMTTSYSTETASDFFIHETSLYRCIYPGGGTECDNLLGDGTSRNGRKMVPLLYMLLCVCFLF